MPHKVLLIAGFQRSGKDTAARIIEKELKGEWVVRSCAERLKALYCHERGLTMDELELLKNTDPNIRTDLIKLGKQKRQEDIYYWPRIVLENNPGVNLIIPDWRFLSEYDFFLQMKYKVLTCWVHTFREVRAERGVLSNENDSSEREVVDKFGEFDYIIPNNEDLPGLRLTCGVVADSINNL